MQENGAGRFTLHRRGREYVIRVDGHDLMNSRMHGSEEQLSVLGCARAKTQPAPRVLVGGLGMGFTLRAALGELGPRAVVEVAELVPAVVKWNRNELADLATRPLEDPRVTVLEMDVGDAIRAEPERYDVILLDVDNGPTALSAPSNNSLYSVRGVARAAQSLKPGGALAVWSATDSPRFTSRLQDAGLRVEMHRVRARIGKDNTKTGPRHVIWVGSR